MRINCVFNLDSVEELRQLTEALEETATFQAKILMENQLKELKAQKQSLREQIAILGRERDGLKPNSDIKPLKEEAAGLDERTDAAAPLSLRAEAERVIENIEPLPMEESEHE